MDSQQKLQQLCLTMVPNAYFDPPDKLIYPCIKYQFDNVAQVRANDHSYQLMDRYTLTHMYFDINESLKEKILDLPYTHLDRHYISDDLHHDVYTIYL